MRILFDTSVAIAFRDGDPRIVERAGALEPVALLSAVSLVELESGVAAAAEGRAQRRAAPEAMREVLDILAFGEAEAAIYGQIVLALGFSRRSIIDRMIAAQSLAAGARLASLNVRDFEAIPDLEVENWSA